MENEASISIDRLEMLGGFLPARANRLVMQWGALHKEELGQIGSGHCERRLWNSLSRSPSIDLMEKLVHVTAVEPLGGHRLRLKFDDGATGELDFSGEAWGGVFAPLADSDYFDSVKLDEELGTVVWPNGADIAPETLHRWVAGASGPAGG
jgi:Protein of unknown function (DUF2442)/Domain of unknown function (DUF4160)